MAAHLNQIGREFMQTPDRRCVHRQMDIGGAGFLSDCEIVVNVTQRMSRSSGDAIHAEGCDGVKLKINADRVRAAGTSHAFCGQKTHDHRPQ